MEPDEVKVSQTVTQRAGDDSTGNSFSQFKGAPPWAWILVVLLVVLVAYITGSEFGWW